MNYQTGFDGTLTLHKAAPSRTPPGLFSRPRQLPGLPAPLINRLDDLTARINASPRALERRFKRTDTLREALVRGIKVIEAELAKEQRAAA